MEDPVAREYLVKIEEWVAQVKGWLETFLEKMRRRPPEDYFM